MESPWRHSLLILVQDLEDTVLELCPQAQVTHHVNTGGGDQHVVTCHLIL